jgi:hypothetical protein
MATIREMNGALMGNVREVHSNATSVIATVTVIHTGKVRAKARSTSDLRFYLL